MKAEVLQPQYVENKGVLVPKTGIPVFAEVFPRLVVIRDSVLKIESKKDSPEITD